MNIKCSSCNTVLRIDESKHNQETIVVQCPSCSQKIRVPIPVKNKPVQTFQATVSTKPKVENAIFQRRDVESEPVYVETNKETSFIMYIFLAAFLFCSCYAIYDIFFNG